MLRQGDEGTSLDEIFRKAEIDLPQQFRTIDYMRDRSRFEGAMRKARFTLAPLRRQLPAALPPKMGANQPSRLRRSSGWRKPLTS